MHIPMGYNTHNTEINQENVADKMHIPMCYITHNTEIYRGNVADIMHIRMGYITHTIPTQRYTGQTSQTKCIITWGILHTQYQHRDIRGKRHRQNTYSHGVYYTQFTNTVLYRANVADKNHIPMGYITQHRDIPGKRPRKNAYSHGVYYTQFTEIYRANVAEKMHIPMGYITHNSQRYTGQTSQTKCIIPMEYITHNSLISTVLASTIPVPGDQCSFCSSCRLCAPSDFLPHVTLIFFSLRAGAVYRGVAIAVRKQLLGAIDKS